MFQASAESSGRVYRRQKPILATGHFRRIVMQRIVAILAVFMLTGSAHAAMAPKFERLRHLSIASDHLNEIAHMLSEPIEKIEYFDGGEVRFSGGKCFVAVTIRAKPLSPKELRSAASPDLVGNVGSLQCSGG
jgi:hypothetical protein